MAALPIQRIQYIENPGLDGPDTQTFPIAASQTYIAGAVLVFSSGKMAEAANNPATVVGLADHDAVAVYPAGSATPSATTLFGKTFVDTPSFPGDPSYQRVVLLHNQQYIEISLKDAWALTLIGSKVAGLVKDATSGFWYADSAQTNKIVSIIGLSSGPATFKGVVGDTYARVIAVIDPSGLAI